MLTTMMSNGGIGGGVSASVARAIGAGHRADAHALVLHAALIALGLSPLLILGYGFVPGLGVARMRPGSNSDRNDSNPGAASRLHEGCRDADKRPGACSYMGRYKYSWPKAACRFASPHNAGVRRNSRMSYGHVAAIF